MVHSLTPQGTSSLLIREMERSTWLQKKDLK